MEDWSKARATILSTILPLNGAEKIGQLVQVEKGPQLSKARIRGVMKD